MSHCTHGGVFGNSEQGSAFKIFPPNATLSNNLLVIICEGNIGGGAAFTWTITDNIGGSWTAGPLLHDATNGNQLAMYYKPGATAGVTRITATPSSTAYAVQFFFNEWYNVATSTPSDGNNKHNATGSSATGGSVTTLSNGDLLLCGLICDATVPFNNTVAAGSGFTLLSANRVWGSGTQYQIQSTAGAINPGMTLGTSNTYIMVWQAFKAAAAGTAPTLVPRITNKFTFWMDSVSSATVDVPCTGNMLTAFWDGYNQAQSACTISITDSHSNTWTSRQTSTNSATFGPAVNYIVTQGLDTDAAATTTSAGTTLSLTMANGPCFECEFEVIDSIQPLTSGNFDNAQGSTGTNSTNWVTAGVSITPSTTNGIIFYELANDSGSAITVTGGDAPVLEIVTYPEATGAPTDSLDENNIRLHDFNTTTSAHQYTTTNTTMAGESSTGRWSSVAMCYKGTVVVVPPEPPGPFPGMPQAILAQ